MHLLKGYVEGEFQPDGRPELVVYVERVRARLLKVSCSPATSFKTTTTKPSRLRFPKGVAL